MSRKRSPLQTLTLMNNPYIILQESYLNVSSGSITTPYLTVAKDLTVSGHITSSYPLTLKGNTKKRQNLTSATIICFNIANISLGADVAMRSNNASMGYTLSRHLERAILRQLTHAPHLVLVLPSRVIMFCAEYSTTQSYGYSSKWSAALQWCACGCLSQSPKRLLTWNAINVKTWNQQFGISAAGNTITNGTIIAVGHNSTTSWSIISSRNRPATNGNISATNGSIAGKALSSSTTSAAAGNIAGATGSCTGTRKPTDPTSTGVHLGMYSTYAGGTEICSTSLQYKSFIIPNSD